MNKIRASLLRIRKNIHQIKRRLILLYPKRVRFRVAGQEFSVFGTYSPNHGLGHDFAKNGCHEPVLSHLLFAALKSGPPEARYWDIGAAFGYFVSIAAGLIRPDHVHAFDPGPRGEYLEFNNKRLFDGRVHIVRACATDKSSNKGDAVILDDYAKEHGYPQVIKIDVDGVECEVLRGARETLKNTRPILFLEVHFLQPDTYRKHRRELIAILNDLPYNYQLCRNHRRMNGECEPLSSLAMLPQMRDESFDDYDYLLIARPKTTSQS